MLRSVFENMAAAAAAARGARPLIVCVFGGRDAALAAARFFTHPVRLTFSTVEVRRLLPLGPLARIDGLARAARAVRSLTLSPRARTYTRWRCSSGLVAAMRATLRHFSSVKRAAMRVC